MLSDYGQLLRVVFDHNWIDNEEIFLKKYFRSLEGVSVSFLYNCQTNYQVLIIFYYRSITMISFLSFLFCLKIPFHMTDLNLGPPKPYESSFIKWTKMLTLKSVERNMTRTLRPHISGVRGLHFQICNPVHPSSSRKLTSHQPRSLTFKSCSRLRMSSPSTWPVSATFRLFCSAFLRRYCRIRQFLLARSSSRRSSCSW